MRFGSVPKAILIAIFSVEDVRSFSIERHTGLVAARLQLKWGEERRRGGNQSVVKMHSKSNNNGEEERIIIDAVVEEKTAGLALNGGENTTVSTHRN